MLGKSKGHRRGSQGASAAAGGPRSSVSSCSSTTMSYGSNVGEVIDMAKVDELRQAFGLAHENPEQIAEFVALNLGVESRAERGDQRTAILLEKCYELIYGSGPATSAPAASTYPAPMAAAQVGIEIPPTAMMDVSSWYWQETADVISRHNPQDVIADNFVSYAGSVCAELDRKYHAFTKESGPAQVAIEPHPCQPMGPHPCQPMRPPH